MAAHSSIKKRPHSHGNALLSIDRQARRSRLSAVSPGLKLLFAVFIIVLCVWTDAPYFSLAVAAVMAAVCVFCGRNTLGSVLSFMRAPTAFILVSCIAVAVNLSPGALGFIDIPLFGGYLSVTPDGLGRAAALFLKAYGSFTCLYFVGLSTPVDELIAVLEKLRLPACVIELMYLIYRYIFVLFEVLRGMTAAAEARLGFAGRRSSWYTFSRLGGNLLASSFRRSGGCFDAMESRCYDGRLAFLTREPPLRWKHAAVAAGGGLLLLLLALKLKGKGWGIF